MQHQIGNFKKLQYKYFYLRKINSVITYKIEYFKVCQHRNSLVIKLIILHYFVNWNNGGLAYIFCIKACVEEIDYLCFQI